MREMHTPADPKTIGTKYYQVRLKQVAKAKSDKKFATSRANKRAAALRKKVAAAKSKVKSNGSSDSLKAKLAAEEKMFAKVVKEQAADQAKLDARLDKLKKELAAHRKKSARFPDKQKATKESIVESQGASRKSPAASKFAKIRAKTTPGGKKK